MSNRPPVYVLCMPSRGVFAGMCARGSVLCVCRVYACAPSFEQQNKRMNKQRKKKQKKRLLYMGNFIRWRVVYDWILWKRYGYRSVMANGVVRYAVLHLTRFCCALICMDGPSYTQIIIIALCVSHIGKVGRAMLMLMLIPHVVTYRYKSCSYRNDHDHSVYKIERMLCVLFYGSIILQ